MLLAEARGKGFAVYRQTMRRFGGRFGRHAERQVLTKARLREMLQREDTARALVGSISTCGRDVRSTSMHWGHEGKKLTAAVQFLSWLPPWVKPRTGFDDVETFIDDEHRVEDRHGLGRIPTTWWTLNANYNRRYDIHRLNASSALAREALRTDSDNAADVRFNFVRSAPDLVAFMIALGTELSMRVVMPAVLPSTSAQPYKCMARFETGDNGNPHFHGFAVASGGPRLGRVRGDVEADPQSDEAAWSDDDGVDGDAVVDRVRDFSGDDVSDDDVVAPLPGADAESDVAVCGGSGGAAGEVACDVSQAMGLVSHVLAHSMLCLCAWSSRLKS